MRVLLTYPTMRRRGGVQTFTRQLALELTSLGHEVRGFSGLPESADEPSIAGLPTAASSEAFRPDIIHAQHHLPTLAALLAFPDVPVVFHCHGGSWRDLPFRHPRMMHYLAMSNTLAERIKTECYLRDDEVSVHLNSVDTRRFYPRRRLPPVPRKALVYHGRIRREDPAIQAILAATEAMGISVDFAGKSLGREIESPEEILPNYPLVFASGISALEAMASGCAVCVLVSGACGPMVGRGNFDHIRGCNFSIAINSPVATPEAVSQALANYDHADAARVTARVRTEADSSVAARKLVALYEEVLAGRPLEPADPRQESMAAAAVLRGLTPMLHAVSHSGHEAKESTGGGKP